MVTIKIICLTIGFIIWFYNNKQENSFKTEDTLAALHGNVKKQATLETFILYHT